MMFREMSVLICVLMMVIFNIQAQDKVAFTVQDGSQCNGQRPDGAWDSQSTWSTNDNVSLPPVGNWQGTKVIIQNNIIICNNDDIDLSTSKIDTILMKNGSSLTYRANSTLILPQDAVIIMEENTLITLSNQSIGTLLQIGVDSLWGRQTDCTIDIHGPRSIAFDTDLCPPIDLLPVELGYCSVKAKGRDVDVSFQTLSEINSDYFEIYHATKNMDWVSMAKIDAAGWSNETINYRWQHKNVPFQSNYYQIKQVDLDGSSEWFPIMHATIETPVKVNINNPVSNTLRISLGAEEWLVENENIEFLLLDVNGNEIFRQLVETDQNRIDKTIEIGHISKGIYFLFIENELESHFVEKLIKL